MILNKFAEDNGLPIEKLEDGRLVLHGKYGEIISDDGLHLYGINHVTATAKEIRAIGGKQFIGDKTENGNIDFLANGFPAANLNKAWALIKGSVKTAQAGIIAAEKLEAKFATRKRKRNDSEETKAKRNLALSKAREVKASKKLVAA